MTLFWIIIIIAAIGVAWYLITKKKKGPRTPMKPEGPSTPMVPPTPPSSFNPPTPPMPPEMPGM